MKGTEFEVAIKAGIRADETEEIETQMIIQQKQR